MAKATSTTKSSTTARKTPTRATKKTTTPAKAPAAEATKASPATAAPQAVDASKNSGADDNMFRRIDLLERVAELTNLRKNKVRPIVDATLAALGEALSEERNAAVKPLGRVTVRSVEATENGRVIKAKIKYQPEGFSFENEKDDDDDNDD